MEPTRSHPLWHWLLLLTPAVEMLTVCVLVERIKKPGEYPFSLLLLNLPAYGLLCLGLGIWWKWRHPDPNVRFGIGALIGLAIAAVNGLIALAGCTFGIVG